MSFLIDTDTVSAHLRGVHHVTIRFLQYSGRLHISAISLAELNSWVFRKNTPDRYLLGLNDLLNDFEILDVDRTIAEKSGKISADLMDRGISIATPDLLIACTALVHNLTVVTHNVRDFAVVPGLRLDDWLKP